MVERGNNMPYPVIFVKSFTTPSTGVMLLAATPESAIENRTFPMRFYNFNMVITIPFSFNNTDTLELTDNNSTQIYHLIDRLGNPVLAEQLKMYAGTRRCLSCRFDSVTNTIMVLSNICPTDYYINQWLNPPTSTPGGTTETT